ncbi:hypothetical protein [Amycolatopsis australiensis]|uniref:Uncharacterized protein, RmlC-like cupin domain n=1 Tax=Amycolatopsis australiensis TaxID=546364 RepID=A0A1K1LT40_9PSEU|nr:hypothetical protein [Amycolatopsis australiensis]SFW12806.1 Uncharacterized protein, RmlC-like cupin domain [Amycolatopsis australiensis]
MSTDLTNELRIQTPGFPPYALGAQNQKLAPLVHAGVVDPKGLTCGMVRMEGAHHAAPHIHEHSPIIVFVHQGMIASLVGEELEPLLHAPGSVLWIAPGVPHIGCNLDPVNPAVVLEARTDEAFNADVVRRPDLDARVAERVADLQRRYAAGQLDDQLTRPTVHIVSR